MGGAVMKLKAIILENFRSYKDRVEVDFDNMTAFIGKNDIGKSTILEALEIFFNNSKVKIQQDDLCVHADEDNHNLIIGCEFTDVDDIELVLDTSAPTNLKQENLLNSRGNLEIHKIFNCKNKKPSEEVFIFALHPTLEVAKNLHEITQAKLKAKIKDLRIETDNIDLRSNVSMRQAIYNAVPDLALKEQLVSVKKGELKSAWDKLKFELPVFSLFQSDRPSSDSDSEVQDPMKVAVDAAIATVEEKLDEIKETVMREAIQVANNTLDKLKEMDATLANQLSPNFSEEPNWGKIFKLSLDGDDGIPINKRGSGVRRLILLNFFRAEAEKQVLNTSGRSIIYAVEEPETAQHPSNQIMLAEALLSLSENKNTQVILTTHVPHLASLLPTESIRFIKPLEKGKEVLNATEYEGVLDEVAESLGVYPSQINPNELRVIVFVEGINDVPAIKSLSKIMSEQQDDIVNLEESSNVIVLPVGGSTLKDWIDKRYFLNLDLPEVHIYDRDEQTPPKYQEHCDKVNARGDGSVAYLTSKRELENYIHPDVINAYFEIEINPTSMCNVPKMIKEKTIYGESNIKKKLNKEVIQQMTYEQILEVDTDKDIEKWLKTISAYATESATVKS